MKNLLVTSAGGTVGPLVIRMIREALPGGTKISAADASVDVSHLSDVDVGIIIPYASDPSYSEALLAFINEHQTDAILPFSEEECLIVSKLAKDGELPIQYLGMPYDQLSIITDKIKCAEALTKAGIDVPKSEAVIDISTFETQLAQFGYPEKKVVFKPISARGSRGFRVIDANVDPVNEFYRQGAQIFINQETLLNIFGHRPEAIKDYFLMEFLPGKSASVDLVAWRGKPLGIYPHFRLGNEWGFMDMGEIRRDAQIEAYCTSVIATLGMHGLCNIEVGYRDDGSLSLIEVNGRTSATAYQNGMLGKNCFEMLMNAMDGKPEPFEFEKSARYRVLSESYEV